MSRRRGSIRLARVGTGLVLALAAVPAAQAQETTSQLNGFVMGGNGQPVAGARVSIVHLPSGTATTTTTSASGQFTARRRRAPPASSPPPASGSAVHIA